MPFELAVVAENVWFPMLPRSSSVMAVASAASSSPSSAEASICGIGNGFPIAVMNCWATFATPP